MTERLFAPRAVRELEEAAAWIAGRDVVAAEGLLRAALAAAQRLSRQPELARGEPRLAPERFRFWSLRGYPYLLVIDAEHRPVIVARVVHASRDLPMALGDLGD
jgi:plasmid stabilization system protein ParE